MLIIQGDIIEKNCSPFAKTESYIERLSFKISLLNFLASILKIKRFNVRKKDFIAMYKNFEYGKIIEEILRDIYEKDLFPIYDYFETAGCIEDIERALSTVPVCTNGYYGNYDGTVNINDLTDVSDAEKTMALIFESDEFMDWDEDLTELLNSIADKEIIKKIKYFIDNFYLGNIYKHFKDDVKGKQYKDDAFMRSFIYLADRLCQNTGCPFIDATPEMADQEIHDWSEIDGYIENWAEFKPKEKALSIFLRKLTTNKKWSQRFYKTLFEIVSKYAEPNNKPKGNK